MLCRRTGSWGTTPPNPFSDPSRRVQVIRSSGVLSTTAAESRIDSDDFQRFCAWQADEETHTLHDVPLFASCVVRFFVGIRVVDVRSPGLIQLAMCRSMTTHARLDGGKSSLAAQQGWQCPGVVRCAKRVPAELVKWAGLCHLHAVEIWRICQRILVCLFRLPCHGLYFILRHMPCVAAKPYGMLLPAGRILISGLEVRLAAAKQGMASD